MTASLGAMTLPSWASHLEYKLAPPPLLLVQAFVNTLDLEQGTDILAQPAEARASRAALLANDAAKALEALDTAGVANRKQSRSKYGAKRPKAAAK